MDDVFEDICKLFGIIYILAFMTSVWVITLATVEHLNTLNSKPCVASEESCVIEQPKLHEAICEGAVNDQ